MKYPTLMHNLAKVSPTAPPLLLSCGPFPPALTGFVPLLSLQSSVQINRRVLSDLAVTEPRTFLSLAKLAQARREEGFLVALGDGKEPEGVFSRVTVLQ